VLKRIEMPLGDASNINWKYLGKILNQFGMIECPDRSEEQPGLSLQKPSFFNDAPLS